LRASIYAFFTGVAAFVFVVVAMRELTSAFGNTVANSLAVLCAALFGLVLGMTYFARKYDTTAWKSRTLGLIYLAAAISFLILITVLPGMHRAYAFIHTLGPTSPAALMVTVIILSTAVVLVPCLLLGGGMVFLLQLMPARAKADAYIQPAGWAFLGIAAAAWLSILLVLPVLGARLSIAVAAIVLAALSAATMLSKTPAVPESRAPAMGGHVYARRLWLFPAAAFLTAFSSVSSSGRPYL